MNLGICNIIYAHTFESKKRYFRLFFQQSIPVLTKQPVTDKKLI